MAQYTIYQKAENEEEFTEKRTTGAQRIQLNQQDGILDLAEPDRPIAELSLIRGDGWNLKLSVKSGDKGTSYNHKIIGKVGKKEYVSNETNITVTTGVAGYAYCIDQNAYTDPGKEINAKPEEDIIIERVKINANYIIHLKAIDYAGNESEILHMPLKFVFRDLNLFKEYQEAGNFDETGIARTPGWNYTHIRWNRIEIAKGDPSELPEVVLVIDVSSSMSGTRINIVRAAGCVLIDNLFKYYPTMKVSIIKFSNYAQTLITSSTNPTALKNIIRSLSAGGATNIGDGVRVGTNILLNSTQKNKVLIAMTDGQPWAETYDCRTMLKRAQDNGIKNISLMIDSNSISHLRDYSKLYQVRSADNSLFDTIAYSLYQEIEDTMIARYYPYREQEGQETYTQITASAVTDREYPGDADLIFPDSVATDKAGPNRPIITLSESANRDGNIQMKIWTEDRGTAYEFYVKFVHPRTKAELYSNPVTQEIKTGIKGYAWTITDNATTDPGGTIRNLQFTFGKEFVGKWLHIRAVDYAGNLGEVCHIKLETSRFISWEELNERKELFCVQYGQTIPAREDEKHLNAVVKAGSGAYAISEVVTDPKTGDRIGTRFVEGTMNNIYGKQDIYSYSLGKYIISPGTPKVRPGKEGNASDQEAYILNHYEQNGSLNSAIQKAMYHTEISKGNVTWNWDETPESTALLAEANAYAAYKRKGYEFTNIKLDTSVYMDDEYKDLIMGPFILNYEPQGLKYNEKILYFANIVGMKIYNQNDEVIAELDKNAKNIGNIEVEFIYTGTAIPNKRYEEIFSREKYKFPVGYEEFYIKFKYKKDLETVTKINKIEFIHNQYEVDAMYNVLDGTYNKVKWTPNRITSKDKDVLWCHEVDNGLAMCIHDKTYSHIIGCYFYLTATVYNSYRNIPSQKLVDVLWTKSGYKTRIQTLVPGSGEEDPAYPKSDEFTNDEWNLVMDITGNVWHDGMEDKNNGRKENIELGIEKVRINIYQIDKNGVRTGINYYTHTDNVGNYVLKDIAKGMYELEFTYNGQIYRSTKLLVNGNAVDYKNDFTHSKYKNNSVAEETEEARQELNNAYTEIAGNSSAIGVRGEIPLTYEKDINVSYIQTTEDGYTKPEFEIASKTATNNIYYPISKHITINNQKYIKIVDSENVNLGLAERYKTDTILKNDLYEAIFSIKEDKQNYIFSERNIRDINSNIEKDEYEQEINRADYNWKLEDILNKAPTQDVKDRLLQILGSKEDSELEAYLDYIIVIRNSGEKDKVQISELANYFSKDLEYLTRYRDFEITSWAQVKYDELKEGENRNKTDKIPIAWSENSKFGGVNNKYSEEYNKIYTTGLDREELRVQKGEFLEVHIILKVKKDENGRIELDESNSSKASMTEINGYKTYYIADGKVAGLIDLDSQPGNANPNIERMYQEDDEDKAPTLKLKLSESANGGDSLDGQDQINKDENGNIVGYGNVLEGNVWEDLKTTENIQKLVNNQIISDGIRQEGEPLIQNIKVELIEYFKHPIDSTKDVYLPIKTQNTRAVLSLSNGEKLEGGYSFINLASGNYKIKFTYGNSEQLQENMKYNGQDYQGILTQDIYEKEGTTTTYEDVEIMLVADVSGSMSGSVENIKDIATKLSTGIYDKLPKIKIGLTEFKNVAEVLVKPDNNQTKLQKAISSLGADNKTAIGYGINEAINNYSKSAKQKIMILLTDSEETVQNIEQVIKTLETATDENNINLTTILSKENREIFGTEEEPRRGTVYQMYNADENVIIENICKKIADESNLEHQKSSAKDLEGDINIPGTRAYSINKYRVMTLEKAVKIDLKGIDKLIGDDRKTAIETFANETYMNAETKIVTYRANNTKISKIHELNLALMERPKTKLTIDTQITAIKITLSDDTVLIDTEKGLSKNVNGLDKEEVPISIYMDEEIMHGATLEVKYKIHIQNDGDIDTLANYLTGASMDTVTTRAKLIFNYTSKNMLYRDENNTWDNIEISDVKGAISEEAIKAMEKRNKESTNESSKLKIYQTEGFGIELYPKGSREVIEGKGNSDATFTVTLSKLITGENAEADLTFDSSMEIVERENTAGRRSETEVPGNYVPDTTPIELDAIKNRKIIITRPWGENRSRVALVVVILALGTIAISTGVYLRKKNK